MLPGQRSCLCPNSTFALFVREGDLCFGRTSRYARIGPRGRARFDGGVPACHVRKVGPVHPRRSGMSQG